MQITSNEQSSTVTQKKKKSALSLMTDGLQRVKKFSLDDDGDKWEYEKILNDPNCKITRDEFTYDKMGGALITIWFTDENF